MATREMERVTARIHEDDVERIDEHVDEGQYPNRSEYIRAAVKLLDENTEIPSEEDSDGS